MTSIKYSETFFSLQGEGRYVGHPSVWLRFAKCNLQCRGFGQVDPTNPDTYDLKFLEWDPKDHGVERVEDLPVFEQGCDSVYTWNAKCKHLITKSTAVEICDILEEHMKNEFNPEGKFLNPHTEQHNHMCFTGGEPMYSQKELIAVMDEFAARGNMPAYVTIETNTTKLPTNKFKSALARWHMAGLREIFFSCSPKLYSVSGEKPEKAIKPEVFRAYTRLALESDVQVNGQIKIVATGTPQTWEEFERAANIFKMRGVFTNGVWPIYAMPCGATLEEQEITAADVATQASQRGYLVAPRVHVYLFGNQVGT